jgi:1-acyl-sn-glycerol-3-phosphate acyltransferase
MEEKQSVKPVKNEKKKYSILFKKNRKGRSTSGLLKFLRVIFIPFYFLLKPFRFYGNKKVPDGACVFVGNHYTLFDIVYPACLTWDGIHFLSKKENMNAPLLGSLCRAVKVISVNRDGNDVRALLDCFKCLKNGEKISIYPEGTRNKTDAEMLPFKHGAAIMAIKAKVPVIPVMLYSKPRFFRCTHVLVGDPVDLSEFYDRKLTDEEATKADDKIREVMLGLRQEHKEYLENKKKKK